MHRETLQALKKIGELLDDGLFPTVQDGGIVMPGRASNLSVAPGEDTEDVRSKTRGSSTGSRKGTTGGQGSPGGSGPSSETAPTVISDLESAYCEQLEEIDGAYPGRRVWWQLGGLWLLITAGLVHGSPVTARFLVAVPFDGEMPKAWAFWDDGSWIGPRHTNFADGSICCMHTPDNTWTAGESLVDLFNLYTLWAVRHLHVRLFGRWPGRQVAILRHERLTEIADDEQCGCGSAIPYAACCKEDDLKRNKLDVAIEFALYGRDRAVPTCIWRFLNGQSEPPQFEELGF